MISMIHNVFANVGYIIVWVLIPGSDRDLEGQRGRFMRYSAEDGSDSLPRS